MRVSYGFTLIELIIVLALISILASISLPIYIKYQHKAKLSSHAEPIARFCLMDIISYCNDNPNISVNITELRGCSNTTVMNYEVTIAVDVDSCSSNGLPQRANVRASIDGVSGYVECELTTSSGEGIKCAVR